MLQRIKTVASKILNRVPAISKVVQSMGSAVFMGKKAVGWYLRLADGFSHPLGLTIGVTAAATSGVTGVITRYFNMTRQEDAGASNSNISNTSNTSNATWTYPGVETTNKLRAGYLFLQGNALIFMCGSSTNGYLSIYSLSELVSKFTHKEVDVSCYASNIVSNSTAIVPTNSSQIYTNGTTPDNTTSAAHHASLQDVIILHLVALLPMHASARSFKKYNLKRVREYYQDYFIDGQINHVKHSTLLKVLSLSVINSIGTFYANNATFNIINENMLCHISPKLDLSNRLILGVSAVTAFSNLIVNGLMTLAASDKQEKGQAKTERESILKDLPEIYTKADPFIDFIILLNSIILTGLGTIISVVHLPGLIDPEFQPLAYDEAFLIFATVMAMYATQMQYSGDTEGYNKELAARKNEASRAEKLVDVDVGSVSQVSLASSTEPPSGIAEEDYNYYRLEEDGTTIDLEALSAQEKPSASDARVDLEMITPQPKTPLNVYRPLSPASLTMFGDHQKKLSQASLKAGQSNNQTTDEKSIFFSP